MKIKANTRILFISEESGYVGWNTMANLVGVLAGKFSEDAIQHSRIDDVLKTLAERGWLSPQDTYGASHWIVEKAVPFDIRAAAKGDEIPLDELLKQLKV